MGDVIFFYMDAGRTCTATVHHAQAAQFESMLGERMIATVFCLFGDR